MEVTGKIIERMVKSFPGELAEAGLKPRLILDGAKRHLAPLQEIGTAIFDRWAQIVKARQGSLSRK